ncbi:hypothetical protein PM082_014313 [Marasmius tenuissimus]|nr:hypothetical protein PM082_014313 [Marasmius tenuissimus]
MDRFVSCVWLLNSRRKQETTNSKRAVRIWTLAHLALYAHGPECTPLDNMTLVQKLQLPAPLDVQNFDRWSTHTRLEEEQYQRPGFKKSTQPSLYPVTVKVHKQAQLPVSTVMPRLDTSNLRCLISYSKIYGDYSRSSKKKPYPFGTWSNSTWSNSPDSIAQTFKFISHD